MKIASTAFALSLAATGSMAQDLTYLSFGAGLSNISTSGPGLRTIDIEGSFEYNINSFVFMGDARQLNFSGDFGEDRAGSFGLRAGYEFAPGTLVYAGVARVDVFGDPTDSFEAGAQYGSDSFDVGVRFNSFNDESLETTTVAAAYKFTPGSEVGIAYSRTNVGGFDSVQLFGSYQAGAFDVSGSIQNIGDANLVLSSFEGTYQFSDQFRATGGLLVLNDFGSSDTGFTVGAGYRVMDNAWVDLTFSTIAEGGLFQRQDTVGLVFSFEQGERSLVTDRASDLQRRAYDRIGGELQAIGLLTDYGLVFFGT